MSDAPARIWGIVGKGRIEKGYDADLVLVDLEEQRTIQDELQHTKAKWSPWHGETLTGWPIATYLNGLEVWSKQRGFSSERHADKMLFDHSRGGYWATLDGIGLR